MATSKQSKSSAGARSDRSDGPSGAKASASRSTPPGAGAHLAIKETIESIIIAFVFAFVFRAYVVEAFVIPTGSMAPTLLGQHFRVTCDQCGYRFKTNPTGVSDDNSGSGQAGPLRRDAEAICPMCFYPNPLVKGTRARAGDRILVHKYIYSISEPRRWDPVVFKNPNDPQQNYIKRLVGLPGEALVLIEGNVYVKPNGSDDSAWRIARKSDLFENPHGESVQRAMWQPVYHSRCIPLDGGRGAPRSRDEIWQSPWSAAEGAWQIEGRRDYRLTGSGGRIAFAFKRQRQRRVGWYAYNQFTQRGPGQPIEDVRIAATLVPDADGAGISMHTTARLDQVERDAQPIRLTAAIAADGVATIVATDPATPGQQRVLVSGQAQPFKAGRATRVELWYVDQQASLWINGRRLLEWSFALPYEALFNRQPLASDQYPQVAIEVAGSPATLYAVEVDRDVSYTSSSSPAPAAAGRGALLKSGSGQRRGGPLEIEPDQFFCLGDNSPLSNDGRFWTAVNPGVEAVLLEGHKNKVGIVPRKLMIGRAFFVYYPAPFPPSSEKIGIFPNFGEMRFIR